MRTHTYCSLAIVALVLSAWCAGAADKHRSESGQKAELVFEAQPTKPVYRKGEAVEFNFNLHNVSRKKVLVARTFQLTYYVDLEILDQEGERAEWCGRVVSQIDSARSFTVLPPGGAVEKKLAISCVNKGDPSRAWGYELHNPGKYIIKATYRLPQPKRFFEKFFPNAPVVRGPISADPVTIEVE